MLKDKLRQLIDVNINAKLFPCCSIGVITPKEELVVCRGTYTYDDARPISDNSVFDAASLTKVLPTSSSALKLIEENRLSLSDDVRKYLPEYKNRLTVWNLLTQTVYYEFGFPLSSLSHKPPAEILKAIAESLVKTTRNEYHYTNSSSILLGLIVEHVYGQNLAAVAQNLFFKPLAMTRSGFDPLAFAPKTEIVPTEIDKAGSSVHAVVHDESARAFLPKPVGSAGLFTTVPDLLKFSRMLLDGGQANDQHIFAPSTIALMASNQLEGGGSVGLGWELNQPHYMGTYAKGTFGKTGFTGCVMLINPGLGSAIVVLSNHIHPKRPDSFKAINDFRRTAADLAFGSTAA